MIEITDEAITQLLENQRRDGWKNVRLGITGGGCAGFEYIFDSCNHDGDTNDVVIPFGKFNILVDKISVPYLVGMTLDFQHEGLNKLFWKMGKSSGNQKMEDPPFVEIGDTAEVEFVPKQPIYLETFLQKKKLFGLIHYSHLKNF